MTSAAAIEFGEKLEMVVNWNGTLLIYLDTLYVAGGGVLKKFFHPFLLRMYIQAVHACNKCTISWGNMLHAV